MEARIDSRFARVLVAGTATMALAAGMAALAPAAAQAKSAKPSVKITAKAATYDGEAYDGGVKITNKSDATIYYATGKTKLNYKNYKTAGVTAAPTRTKAGSTTVKWIAVPKDVKKASIFNTRTGSYRIKINAVSLRSDAVGITKASEEAAYTGKNVDPGISVKWGGKELKKGTDYTVKYANAVKPSGKYSYATATITGKGNFKSSKTVKYRVVADAQVTHANGAKEYKGKLADAINNATSGDKIKMLRDVDVQPTDNQYVKTTVTLDLNGFKMYNTKDLWSDDTWSLVAVHGGDLTIIDTSNEKTGALEAKENDCFCVDVCDEDGKQSSDKRGGKLTIKAGKYKGNIHAVYVTRGEADIQGGYYSVQQKYTDGTKANEFVLNLLDSSCKANIASITVTGGTFENFNPADCWAEGEHTDFVKDGYKVIPSTNSSAVGVMYHTVTKA